MRTTELCSVQEAAAYFKVTDRTIRRWISTGEIQAERFGPRLVRVDISSMRSQPLQVTEADRG